MAKAAKRKTNAKVKTPGKPGRPTDYSAILAEEICWLVTIGKTIEEIGETQFMPAERTIYQWLAKYPEFAQDYAQARENRHIRKQDKLGLLAGAVLSGRIPPDAFNAAARQMNWQSEREAPKKYGRNINLNHGGKLSLALGIADIVAEAESAEASEPEEPAVAVETEHDGGDG